MISSAITTSSAHTGYLSQWASDLQAELQTQYRSIWLTTTFGTTHVWAAQTNDTQKPNLLMIPGWGACGLSWDLADQIQYYTPNYNVYLLDNLGQPGLSSPVPLRGFRATQYSLWIKEVCEGLGLERLSVLGESFGGFLSMLLALSAPHRLEKAILFAPAGLVQLTIGLPIISRFAALRINPTPRTAGRFLKHILYNAQYPRLPAAIKSRMTQFMALAFRHNRLLPPPLPYVLSDIQLQQIRVPVVLLTGQYDRMFDAQRSIARARRCMPTLIAALSLPNADHTLIIHALAHEQARHFLSQ